MILHPSALAALSELAASLADVPQNGDAWTYTINGRDGLPYLTRTLLPRIGDYRVMLHHIHRPDADRWLHNHPWFDAHFLILSGGYVEHRLVGDEVVSRTLAPGDVNSLTAATFHRIDSVLPGTRTMSIVGPRTQDWGFLVDGRLVPHAEYFASVGHIAEAGASQS